LRKVRRYKPDDVPALLEIVNSIETDSLLSEMQLAHQLRRNDTSGGKTWIIKNDGLIQGYAALIPVPALNGVFDLEGGISPQSRRQGFGSFLLKQMLKEIPHGEMRLITHSVESLDELAAAFLMKNGFKTEHVEWQMLLEEIPAITPENNRKGIQLQLQNRQAAAESFLSLYDASFSGLPWYQPYHDVEEVLEEMGSEDIILILREHGNPVGFVWLRWIRSGVAEFEPLGIIQSRQDRGLGTVLLRQAIQLAADRGASKVSISVWSSNEPAIRLYQNLGFVHRSTRTYLGLELHI
jgi:mycothiol synthase